MGNLLDYSGIVTKIRAMEAKLLKPEQYEIISGLHNVPEVCTYLKEHSSYSEVLNNIDEARLHRGDIEKILIQSLYRDYQKIYLFCSLEQRKFLKLYIKRYEIDLINYCFRIVINHYDQPFDLNYKKAFFDKYSQISIEKLITSRTTDELVENLKDTEYYSPLAKFKDSPSVTLFDYDLALDLYYFSTIWKDRKKVLKKKELEIFTRDCGSEIDLLNLQWIYRAKKYYTMNPADIYSLLIPIHYKLSIDLLKELVECSNIEEFYDILRKTSYSKHYDFKQNLTIEQMYTNCLYHLYTIDRRYNPYSIATINTYLFLKEEELRKLTTAIECIRYKLTPGETLAHVGGITQ
jgi:V/A-type H+-transporting ATPase subunit C